MSQYYYLANKKNKTLICLGKSHVLGEIRYELEALFDLEYLTEFILDNCYGYYNPDSWLAKNPDQKEWIVKELAPSIFELGKNVSNKESLLYFSDSTDHLYCAKCLGYKMIYSVFGQDEVDKFNQKVKENKNNWYSLEKAKKIPGIFEEFV